MIAAFQKRRRALNRPGAITASIVVMSIVSFIGFVAVVFFVFILPFGLFLSFPLIVVGIVPWLLDVLFLVRRRRWVYYYNIVLHFLLVWGALGQAAAFIFSTSGLLGVLLAIIPAVAGGFLIWLCVELIRRKNILRQYLDMGASQGQAAPVR